MRKWKEWNRVSGPLCCCHVGMSPTLFHHGQATALVPSALCRPSQPTHATALLICLTGVCISVVASRCELSIKTQLTHGQKQAKPPVIPQKLKEIDDFILILTLILLLIYRHFSVHSASLLQEPHYATGEEAKRNLTGALDLWCSSWWLPLSALDCLSKIVGSTFSDYCITVPYCNLISRLVSPT